MGKRRWDRKRRTMRLTKTRVAARRSETIDVYRDPETKLLLKAGPDHGTEERKQHDGGIVVGDKVLGLAQTAWAVAPGALERLRHDGGLTLGFEEHPDIEQIVRRWMQAAETLRLLATRAGCQRRTTGRYDFGAIGKGEMSDKAAAAFRQITELAERMGWDRLGVLLDLVLYERLPAPLVRPRPKRLPQEGEDEFAGFLDTARRNPTVANAMHRSIEEHNAALPRRQETWAAACWEVQQLIERLAFTFRLPGPRLPQ